MTPETKRKIEEAAHDEDGHTTFYAFKRGAHFGHALGVQEERERMRFEMNQFILAYAPDFFSEPDGFTPKLDINSAAMVRIVLGKLITPPTDKEEHGE